MAFTPKSAKNAQVRIGSAVVFTAKLWTVTAEADEIDTSNFESAGFYTYIGGLIKASIHIEFDFDSTANPYDAIGNAIGTIYSTGAGIKLYLNLTTGPFWQFQNVLVKSAPNTADVKVAQKGVLDLLATGTYVFPTGAF